MPTAIILGSITCNKNAFSVVQITLLFFFWVEIWITLSHLMIYTLFGELLLSFSLLFSTRIFITCYYMHFYYMLYYPKFDRRSIQKIFLQQSKISKTNEHNIELMSKYYVTLSMNIWMISVIKNHERIQKKALQMMHFEWYILCIVSR